MAGIECQTEPTYDSIKNHKITVLGCDTLIFHLIEAEKTEWPLKDSTDEENGQMFRSFWGEARSRHLTSKKILL
jgi:hypothetical protein